MVAQLRRDQDTRTATELEVVLLAEQLDRLERPQGTAKPVWPWLLVILGVVAMVGLSLRGYGEYTTVNRINVSSHIATDNPLVLFQDVATNGPRIDSRVDTSSRATYSRALEQFVLDGTGVCLGIVLLVAGLFVRANL